MPESRTPVNHVETQTSLPHAEHTTLTTAVRRLTFCAGHRIWGHETKCQHLHGHNYELHVHAAASSGLDALGRVIDFSILKERVGNWLENNWDHGTIVFGKDIELIQALRTLPGQKLYIMPTNPTAENMALHLFHSVIPELLNDTGVSAIKLTLWETENCYVEVSK